MKIIIALKMIGWYVLGLLLAVAITVGMSLIAGVGCYIVVRIAQAILF